MFSSLVTIVRADHPDLLVLCWCSPPCTGGCPILNLIQPPRRSEIQEQRLKEFFALMTACEPIVECGQIKCLELSKVCSYWSHNSVQAYCRMWGLRYVCDVPRCSYDNEVTVTAKHLYRIASSIVMFAPRQCTCLKHMPLNSQSLEGLGKYPPAFVSDVVSWFRTVTRSSIAAA